MRGKQAAAIRKRATKPLPRSASGRRWAIAAAILLALGAITWRFAEQRQPAHTMVGTVAVAGDIDGDGRLDILDAFALARHLETRADLDARDDINHDGHVDQDDVAALARAAVALGHA